MRKTIAIIFAAFVLNTAAIAADTIVDIKILFCACGVPGLSTNYLNPTGGVHEDAILMPWYDWYHSTGMNTVSVREMIINGWQLHSIVPRGSSGSATVVDEMYFTFVKYAPVAPIIPTEPPVPERVRPAAATR